MLSVRGTYDGRRIKPLEKFRMPPNTDVIITFIDSEQNHRSVNQKNQELLKLCGAWKDNRPVEEIIKDIYDSRTSSQKEINL